MSKMGPCLRDGGRRVCCYHRQRLLGSPNTQVISYLILGALFLLVNNANALPTAAPTLSEMASTLAKLNVPPDGETTTTSVTRTTTYTDIQTSKGVHRREETVCESYHKGDPAISIPLNTNVMKIYLEGCTVIEGSLQIYWMFSNVSPKNYTDLVFPELVEITGYLLFFRVNGLDNIGRLFPNLRVIRGQHHFYRKLALILFENENLLSLSLGSLQYVGGDVLAMVNPQLCYVDDHVKWDSVIATKNEPFTLENRRRKDGCDLIDGCNDCRADDGKNYCWDRTHCQQVCDHCKVNRGTPDAYNPGCDSLGRCCHDQCLGGCNDTLYNSPFGCFACKNFFHEGECLERCPVGSDGKQLLEINERRCMTEEACFAIDHRNKIHGGKCILECPSGYMDHSKLLEDNDNPDVHVCVPCEGQECRKVCPGGTISSVTTAKAYLGCTDISGFLEIALPSTENGTELTKYLSSIVAVSDYVKITRCPLLQTLSFLNNLKTIYGDHLHNDRYALYVMSNDNLELLWNMEANPILTIEQGWVFFQRNRLLCLKEINKLMDNAVFNGKYKDEVDNQTKNITAEVHSVFDVSNTTNGQEGDCFNNSLTFHIWSERNAVSFNFTGFDIGEERLIITYLVYYRKVEEDELVSYYRSGFTCDTTEQNQWQIFEKDKLDTWESTKDGRKVYSDYILDFDSYARYAAYVQTYLTQKINMDGARSSIIYFRTKAQKPSKPRNIRVASLNIEDNIALTVSWDPPGNPNGIIDSYYIYYKKMPWRTDLIYQKKFCGAEGIEEDDEEEEKPETTIATVTDGVDTAKCECKTDEDKDKPDTLGERNVLNEYRHDFENYLQNTLFTKSTGSDSLREFTKGRRKREINLASSSGSLNVVDGSTVTYVTPVTTVTTMNTTVITFSNTITPLTTTAAAADEDDDDEEDDNPVQLSVVKNLTETSLHDLEANMEYSIEVVACQAFDKEDNVTRCSKRAISKGITRSNMSYDVIDADSFTKQEIYDEERKNLIGLNISWSKPKETNGPVLSYTFRYFSEKSVKVEVGDTLTREQKITEFGREKCIEPLDFKNSNYTFNWKWIQLLRDQDYNISVRVRTVGTKAGRWTYYPHLIHVPSLDPDDPIGRNQMIAVSVAVVVTFLIVTIAVIGVIWKVKKKKPMPLATLHNSFNPDYMEEVYEPDEWELDRAKVKIGKSLGQGSFGMVYEGEAKDLLNTDKKARKVAIKTVNDTATLSDRIQFLNEASRMKAFKCHHIVQLLGVVSQGQPVLVIMELMAFGDLKNYLRMHRPDEPDNDGRKPPTLKEIWQMAAEIADGMAYLASEKFVHRDLAARNCMVSDDMTVKIGDFGMARDIYDADYYRKGGKGMLPVRWMAPESLRDGIYTSKSDVWSYGVVLWEMATLAAQPYQGFSNEEVLRFVIDNRVMEKPVGCPNRLYNMMKRCWEYYPRYRPSFKDLIEELQGDVKKSFFAVSYYYNSRHDDGSDDESDSLIGDNESGDTQPLHMSSHHSSGQQLHAPQSHDLDLNQIEDDASLGSCEPDDRGLVVDMQMLPMEHRRMNTYGPIPTANPEEISPMMNGHHPTTSDSESEAESSLCESSPPMKGSSLVSPTSSKPNSSVMSGHAGPPSYNTALVDHRILPNDSQTVWSGDGSQSNSCNGSANGHLHFGNQLTSAC